MNSIKPDIHRIPIWAWCLFLLVLWQLGLWAQNPGLMSDDSGEMVAAAYTLGLPHPPGYPLFCLLGRLFSFVPVGTIAFRLNLLSESFVLAALVFVGLSVKKEEDAWWTPTFWVAVFFLFSCRSVFAQTLTAKGGIYTLTLLFLSLFWWLRVRNAGKGPSNRLFFFVCFLWAVGMTNHWESEILWVPFLVFWGWQEGFRWDAKKAFQGGAVILTGLSVYLYLPLRAAQKPGLCWGNPVSLSEFWWVVSRKLASGTEPLFRSWSYYLSFLGEYLKVMGTHWMPGILLVALWGGFCLYRSQRGLFYSSLLIYSPMVLGILMVPREETKFLVGAYLVPTQALVAFYLSKGLPDPRTRKGKVGLMLLMFLSWGWFYWIFQKEDKADYTLANDFAVNALKALPSHSILLAEGDNYVMPLLYERQVNGLRKDVVFETAVFLFHEWGWEQLAAQDPEVGQAVRSSKNFAERLSALTRLGSQRGLFYDLNLAYSHGAFLRSPGDWIPWGLEQRYQTDPSTTAEVSDRVSQLVKLERFRHLDRPTGDEEVTTREIRHYYSEQYFGTGRWLRQKGDLFNALVFFDKGMELYPVDFGYSEMGAMAGQLGYVALAKRLCQASLDKDPAYLPAYVNLAYVYHLEELDGLAVKCFDQALQKTSDPEWVLMQKQRFLFMLGKPGGPRVVEKSVKEYPALSQRFEKAGASFLGSLTLSSLQIKNP